MEFFTEEAKHVDKKYLGVLAKFDEKTNERFELIKSQLIDIDMESKAMPPHITLGAYEGVKEKDLCDWICMISNTNKSFEINFNHIGLFSLNVAFLAPQVSAQLTALHRKVHEKYDDCCGLIGYNYTIKSNNWVPHASILINEPNLVLAALPVINNNFQPFLGLIISLSLYEFSPTNEIKKFNLR